MPPKRRENQRGKSQDKSLEIPEGVSMGLWDMLLSIKADTAATSARVDTIENRLDELEDSYPEDIDVKVNKLEMKVDLLSARLDKQEKVSEHLAVQIDDIRAHSMKENIIINFDNTVETFKEAIGENTVEITRHFFTTVLGIENADDLYIPIAHRLGFKKPTFIRSVIVKLPFAMDRDLVMSRANRLRDTRHYISKQLTAKQRERKQFALPVYKELKSDPENKAKLVDDKLYVKGIVQAKLAQPRAINLQIDPDDLPDIEIVKGTSITDGGSTFHGFAASVTSVKEVRQAVALTKTNTTVAAANHCIYAYRLDDGKSNFNSDGDYGIGLYLLDHLTKNDITNVVLIVARDCSPGFTHIGRRRMEHAISVCKNTLPEL